MIPFGASPAQGLRPGAASPVERASSQGGIDYIGIPTLRKPAYELIRVDLDFSEEILHNGCEGSIEELHRETLMRFAQYLVPEPPLASKRFLT